MADGIHPQFDGIAIDKVEVLKEEDWMVKRQGRVEEVTFANGRIQYRVKIWDAGRDAFITQWWNDPTPGFRFLDRIKEENERLAKDV